MEQTQETQTVFIELDRRDFRRVAILAFTASFVACLLALLITTRTTNG